MFFYLSLCLFIFVRLYLYILIMIIFNGREVTTAHLSSMWSLQHTVVQKWWLNWRDLVRRWLWWSASTGLWPRTASPALPPLQGCFRGLVSKWVVFHRFMYESIPVSVSFVSMCVCLCKCLCICMCLCVWGGCLWMSVCMYVCVSCLSGYMYNFISVCLGICKSGLYYTHSCN